MLVPRLRIPFQVTDGVVRSIEQDSDRDIEQGAWAVLSTELGSRLEVPDFGITDQAQRKGGADLAEINAALGRWEPRAQVNTTQEVSDLIARVQVGV